MKVLFAAAELAPLVKVGGLGDVIEALPKALLKLGTDVQIVIPRYTFIEKEGLKLVARDIAVPLRDGIEKVSLYRGKMPGSNVAVFFVDNPMYLSTGPAPYFEQTAFVGAADEIKRFVFFSKAVHVLLERKKLRADIVHAHDWHTGALLSFIKQAAQMKKSISSKLKTVFTIHNLGNQGRWDAKEVDAFCTAKDEAFPFVRFEDQYNFIAEGIENADWITTVSPRYAEEILTKSYGNGLENILLKRKNKLVGILNGIDTDFYNPETDQKIFDNFSIKTTYKKKFNKETLGQAVGISMGDAPLFGLVSRLTEQKGIDLIVKALRMFAGKHDAYFIFLGTGAKEYEDQLLRLQNDFPDKVITRINFDETLAHRIYAASDFFLMPSRFEPCGLGQMIAMRYGAIPIVRETGGLADTVHNMKEGFSFEKAMDVSLEKAMREAYTIYTTDKKKLEDMRKEGMKKKLDFNISAKEYQKVYRRVSR